MDNKIDLNQADRDTLARLSGIGEKLADRIIEYRETTGPFTEVNDLTSVPGISENMVREIEDQLIVTVMAEADAARVIEDAPMEEVAVSSPILEDVKEGEMPAEVPAKPVAAPEQPSISPPPSPSRSSFWDKMFTAIAGALLGTFLTLTILWLLNGSLQLNETAQMIAFEQQSAQAAATNQAEQTRVGNELKLVSTEVAAMATRESEAASALATAQAGLETAQNRLADTMDEVATLETVTDSLDERLKAVAASAENFDAFMVGMRDLLWLLQGPPPTPTATTTIPAPRITVAATLTPTIDATATPTPLATRTPRPTATPLREELPTPTK
jgi:competence ComEA-like helix-hairpin-helix protein